VLRVTGEQRKELNKRAPSRKLSAGDAFRARLILALADRQSYSQIMMPLQTTAPTVSRWKKRFEETRLAGLDPRHNGRTRRKSRSACFPGSAWGGAESPPCVSCVGSLAPGTARSIGIGSRSTGSSRARGHAQSSVIKGIYLGGQRPSGRPLPGGHPV